MAEDVVTTRMVALTDGVLSIAMTLLVLDIRLPLSAANLGNEALWQAVLNIWPQLQGYLLSFLVVAIFWINHAQKFRHLKKVSGTIIWLNILFLLAIGLVPFTTSLLAESGNTVSTVIYAGVMAFASLMLGLMSLHAGLARLTDELVGRQRLRTVIALQVGTVAVFVLSMAVAFFNAELAKYCWLLLVPLNFLSRRNPGNQ